MFGAKNFVVILVLIGVVLSCKEKKAAPKSGPVITTATNNRDDIERLYNLDKSPVDIIYYPEDFPVLKMSGKASGAPVCRIIYSRPSKAGRTIFGNVVKYGTYWRLGANEGTELEFFRDISIKNRTVKKGRYIIYCIPYENKWTIKLNDDLYTWGLRIHSKRDVYSFDIPITTVTNPIEVFTMQFRKSDEGAELLMGWDSVRASLPFKY